MSDTERLKMTVKTVKVANYTPEQTAELVSAYTAESTKATVEAFAAKFAKSSRSIIAKLSKEGVYKAPEKVTKNGEPVIKKDAHADAIGAVLLMTEAEIESLTKANKTALVKIFKALANSKPLED
jgi:hypothetical protein